MVAANTLFTASRAALMCGEPAVSSGPGGKEISSVVVDSREVRKGSLFVALEGERSDGHNYIMQAVERGAVCIIADRKKSGMYKEPEIADRAAVIRTDNPLASLQKLAGAYADRFSSLVRIGITGSSGKTTTKEIMASIFSLSAATVYTKGNLNSEIGLPLSMFSIREEHKYGIFEMGINFKGEMDILAGIYKPEYAVITNIGTAHIGPLGSEKGIAEEKSGIFSYFTDRSMGFLPEKDRNLDYLTSSCGGRYVLFGENQDSLVTGAEDLGIEGWLITCGGEKVKFSLPGRHNLENLYAAVKVAEYFRVDPVVIRRGIEAVSALPGRSRIISSDVTIIEDSYNANGDSLLRAMEYLEGLSWEGRKIAVLGSMKELGELSEEIHAGVGGRVAYMGMDAVFFFGEEMEAAYQAVRDSGSSMSCFYFIDYRKLEEALSDYVKTGDIVLLKGSRSMGLERLVGKLKGEEAVKTDV